VGGGLPVFERSCQQCAGGTLSQVAQGPGDGDGGGGDAACCAGHQGPRRDDQLQLARADGAHPDRREAEHHQACVGDGAQDSEDGAQGGEDQAFAQELAAQAGGGEAEGAEEAHLFQPLLDAEAEEEAREEEGRRHQEEAEVHEVRPEVGGAAGGGPGLLADRRHLQREGLEALLGVAFEQLGDEGGCVVVGRLR
jgi:hypothetical protein